MPDDDDDDYDDDDDNDDECRGQLCKVPPANAGLALKVVSPIVVRVVWAEAWLVLVQEAKGAVVDGDAGDAHVVSVEHLCQLVNHE